MHGRQSSRLRIPLIPADTHADFRIPRPESQKPQIARREVEFLIIQRVIRNMHLAIHPGNRTVRIQHDSRIVIQTRPAFQTAARRSPRGILSQSSAKPRVGPERFCQFKSRMFLGLTG